MPSVVTTLELEIDTSPTAPIASAFKVEVPEALNATVLAEFE
jgi:hypothetical protein